MPNCKARESVISHQSETQCSGGAKEEGLLLLGRREKDTWNVGI